MAINIQYGPVAGLLEAAAAGGQAQYRNQAADRDRALLGQVMQYRLGQQQLEQDAQRLQTAYRSVSQPRTAVTRTAPAQRRVTTPPRTSTAPARLPAMNPGTRQGTGEIAVAGRNYGVDSTGKLIDLDTREEARGNFSVPANGPPPPHPFMEYASQLANRPDIDPQTLAEIGAATQMAIETGMTGNQFQSMVQGLVKPDRPVLSPQFMVNEQLTAIDRNIRTIENQIRDQERLMRDSGIDPAGPPSQLDPGTQERGVLGRVTDFYGGRTGLTDGANLVGPEPDPLAASAYRQAADLRQQLSRLQQQRSEVLSANSTGGGGQSAPLVTSQEGFDALPSGAQYREEPDGPLFIKD